VKILENIFWLGLKEIRSLMTDMVMVIFVIYAFTLAIYVQATGTSSEVNNASIAFVDDDQSALSKELINAFYPPRFQRAVLITTPEVEDAMDKGRFMFVVTIPPRFERDLHAGRVHGFVAKPVGIIPGPACSTRKVFAAELGD